VRISKKVAPATVFIKSVFPGEPLTNKALAGIGSGVLLDEEGLILTNAHLVADASKILVTLHDGTRLVADLVGTDLVTDLALLRVRLPKGFHRTVQLGDSDQAEIGQRVLTIGHPFGLGYALSTGVISGVGAPSEPGIAIQERIIQISAAINPGNSGGPLVDAEGRVIGINSAMLVGAQSIGFAIPINTAKTVVTELLAHGRVIRPWLGISGKLLSEEVIGLFALPLGKGLLVMHIDEGSPAKKAGLLGGTMNVTIEGEPWVLGGDILVAVNGLQVKAPEDFVKLYSALKVGQTVQLSLMRNGSRHQMTVMIEEQPQPPAGSALPKVPEPVQYRPAQHIVF
jgi:S1-C subfamily serine protease